MSRAAAFATAPRLVVKVGSSLLVAPDGHPRRDWLATLAHDIAVRRAQGQAIILVSSGAIALGARRLGLAKGGRTSLEDAQAAAAVGQIALAALYTELLAHHGLAAAQLLLTLDDLDDRRRHLNAAATLERLVNLGAVPIVNENDSVATEEIRFGDNDRLAARVAIACQASAVILLSDVDGLMTADPGLDPRARLIETLDDPADASATAISASGLGTGGMAAKLVAARLAHAAGVHLAIASGREDHPLARFLATGHGTIVPARHPRPRAKAWLTTRVRVAGRLHVDAGAAAALASGSSLLAAGTLGVEGDFRRGDPVDILADGRAIARGLAAYDAADAALIAGKRSDAHADILGYAPRSALVHRDHMVVL